MCILIFPQEYQFAKIILPNRKRRYITTHNTSASRVPSEMSDARGALLLASRAGGRAASEYVLMELELFLYWK